MQFAAPNPRFSETFHAHHIHATFDAAVVGGSCESPTVAGNSIVKVRRLDPETQLDPVKMNLLFILKSLFSLEVVTPQKFQLEIFTQ
jgi:hypothetical protein